MLRRFNLLLPFCFLLLVLGVLAGGVLRRGGTSQVAAVDPVCQMEVTGQIAANWNGESFGFCTENCRERFLAAPRSYLTERCLVCRGQATTVAVVPAAVFPATWEGRTYHFCTAAHRELFRADPGRYFLHTMWGIPDWLYYSSIAIVLLLSFGIFEWAARRPDGATDARVDLLRARPLRWLVTRSWTRFVARSAVVAVFALIVVAGLFGRQLPGKNIAPLLTWTIWWGGLVWLILFLGKFWCYVCPWDAVADWAEGMRFWGVKKEGMSLRLPWPRYLRNIWPATLLFVGLTWVELGFGVTMNPRATAWMAIAMLALGFSSAFLFDRRSFCRYGCLVGRVSGLYALFAPIEVRARDRDVCRSCSTRSCYHGNAKGEACPTGQYLGGMTQNTYCISCLECVKSCESANVGLRLRPWGADLGQQRVRADEAYLALLMLSLTAFHGLSMTGMWQRMVAAIQSRFDWGYGLAFSVGMALVTLLPIVAYALLVSVSRALAGREVSYRRYFVRYAYALLPIALFYHLAHNSEHLFMEGQKLVALGGDPFGFGWNLFGLASLRPAPLADLPTLWLLQAAFVMIGHVYSLWAARRAAVDLFGEGRRALRSQIPMLAATILFSVMSLWLLKLPMEMRSSAM